MNKSNGCIKMLVRIFSILSLILVSFTFAQGHVVLETRLTGESFEPGETIKINWAILVDHDQIDWGLYFSKDGGDTWEPIEEGLPLYQLTYEWSAPYLESDKMLIQIVQNNDMTEDYFDISDTFAIHSETTPALDLSDLKPDIFVSPNPVSHVARLTIHSPIQDLQVSILNAHGQLVEKLFESARTGEDHLYYWHTDKIGSGMYFLEILDDRKVRSLPVIVNH